MKLTIGSWVELSLAALFALPLASGTAIPSPSSLQSDITLLYNNDLDRLTAATHRSALLLSAPRSSQDASKACQALGENLLPVNKTFFKNDLVPLLQYQIYQDNFPENQQFWVGHAGSTCQVVNAQGVVSSSSACSHGLPALCTQSAGYHVNATAQTSLTIHSQDLTITGFRDQTSFRFWGIRYVDPPARWEYATPYTGNKTIDARSYGPECVQTDSTTGSEDCLFLNVWTPFLPGPNSTTPLKAVIFWIHGGAFTLETGSDPIFDGGGLGSRGDVVVVTFNYRLSTLGFLALADGKTNGNYAIADMISALEWVQEYIAAFGGDKDRVTIVGQSAGAAAVHALLGSPKAIGKYAGAVVMSNVAGALYATPYSLYYTIPEEVALVADPILAAVGCNGTGIEPLECLRGVDAVTLINLPTVARFIVVDGTYIISPQLPINGSGPVANVHTMMGNMRDDGVAFTPYPTSGNLTAGLIEAGLNTSIANNPLFPEPSGPNVTLNVFNVTSRAIGDVELRCLDEATVFSGVTHDLFKSVWYYEFNRSYQLVEYNPNSPVCEAPPTPDHPFGDPSLEYFKCHAGEIYYVFGTLDQPYRDDQDLPFMQRMVDIWSSFARTYDPNPDPKFLAARGFTSIAAHLAKEGRWEPVTKDNMHEKPVRLLQWDSSMTHFGELEQCVFLDFPLTYYE
ncbi:carboxylesterase from carbohydrate esterase [Trametes punicea]|nr:carboxylesterase from carbohydrate esterase [Trametes punicea]